MSKYSDISIDFYVINQSIDQLNKLKTSDNLILKDINNIDSLKVPFIGLSYDKNLFTFVRNIQDLNLIRQHYYLQYLKHFFNIEDNIFNNIENVMYENKHVKFIDNDYEYLLINSRSMSLNFTHIDTFIENRFTEIADELNNNGIKFITTEKIKNYDCTRELYPDLIDIYKISKNIKNIIAIDTSPIVVAVNKHNYKSLNKLVYLNQNGFVYSKTIPNSIKITDFNDFKNLKII